MRGPAQSSRALSGRLALALLLAASLPLVGGGCFEDGTAIGGVKGMSGKPRERKRLHVTVRNNCPGAVEVVFAIRKPADGSPTERVAGGGAFQREMSPKERLWLADEEGRFSTRRSGRAESDGYFLEIGDTCDRVLGRPGRM